jgi:hypothetical protein
MLDELTSLELSVILTAKKTGLATGFNDHM